MINPGDTVLVQFALSMPYLRVRGLVINMLVRPGEACPLCFRTPLQISNIVWDGERGRIRLHSQSLLLYRVLVGRQHVITCADCLMPM